MQVCHSGQQYSCVRIAHSVGRYDSKLILIVKDSSNYFPFNNHDATNRSRAWASSEGDGLLPELEQQCFTRLHSGW